MIKVTRLNDTQLYVNSDLIEFVESTPDTMVTLTTGRKIIIKEEVESVIEQIVAYRRKLLE